MPARAAPGRASGRRRNISARPHADRRCGRDHLEAATCYDHLAGQVGVALMDHLLAAAALQDRAGESEPQAWPPRSQRLLRTRSQATDHARPPDARLRVHRQSRRPTSPRRAARSRARPLAQSPRLARAPRATPPPSANHHRTPSPSPPRHPATNIDHHAGEHIQARALTARRGYHTNRNQYTTRVRSSAPAFATAVTSRWSPGAAAGRSATARPHLRRATNQAGT
jgi:hypothetical protein